MSAEETRPLTAQERLQRAEEKDAKHAAHTARLRRVATAEAEVPGIWATGQVSKEKLAETFGVSTATITRILTNAGVPQSRIRRIGDEERKEIVTLLKGGTSSLEIQEAYSISHNTVRNIGLKAGVFRPGERRPHRSDEEYANIQELDELARQRFGAGIYNLGVGLRAWEKKQRDAAKGTESSSAGGIPAEEVSTPVNEGSAAQAIHNPGPVVNEGVDAANEAKVAEQPTAPQETPFDPATEPAPAPVEAPTPSTEGDFKF